MFHHILVCLEGARSRDVYLLSVLSVGCIGHVCWLCAFRCYRCADCRVVWIVTCSRVVAVQRMQLQNL